MTVRSGMHRAMLALAGALAAAAPGAAHAAQDTPPALAATGVVMPGAAEIEASRLRRLFADDAAREDELDPLEALYRGDIAESARFARIFTDSLDRDRLASARQSRRELSGIERSALPPDLQLSYDVFAGMKNEELGWLRPEVRALTGVRPFNHFGGLHVEFPTLMAPGGVIAYADAQDYRDALALYPAFAQVLDNAVLRFREGMASGVVEPRLTVLDMIAQIDTLLASADEASPFFQPVSRFPETVGAAERERLRADYARTIHGDLLPAYRRLRAFLSDEYLPVARDSVGLGQMKGGAGLYRMMIRRETTLPLDPAAVHALGLSEVARIRREMEGVRAQLGFAGTLPAFFQHIRDDPRFHPTSARQLAEGFARIGRQVDAALPRYFFNPPKSPLEIAPYPAYRARFEAGGSYSEGAPEQAASGQHRSGEDRSRQTRAGTFFYNTYDLPHRFLSGMTTLYLHEAVPGHHLQISLAQENQGFPAFQRTGGNSAFVEGWALYAETLGYDMGLYADPLQHWGTLDDEMLRAMRLVVDTGLHAQGWSRARAVDYMLANSGMGRSDAEAEVDRYIALPAQALAYKIGALTIQRLRDRARAALGERFDIRAFHAEVLGAGALPLPILEARIDRWIAAQVSSPSSALVRVSRYSNK